MILKIKKCKWIHGEINRGKRQLTENKVNEMLINNEYNEKKNIYEIKNNLNHE